METIKIIAYIYTCRGNLWRRSDTKELINDNERANKFKILKKTIFFLTCNGDFPLQNTESDHETNKMGWHAAEHVNYLFGVGLDKCFTCT